MNAEVLLPQGDEIIKCKVKQRHKGPDGKVTGIFNKNPILNSIIYDVEFPDGTIREYAANIIAENIYSLLDKHGHRQQILDCIVDHNSNGRAIKMKDKYIVTKSGTKRIRKSTVGWKLKVWWKDGSEQWVPLQLMKESYPVQVADYAVDHKIADQPAFAWWVPYTQIKRWVILSAVKARV